MRYRKWLMGTLLCFIILVFSILFTFLLLNEDEFEEEVIEVFEEIEEEEEIIEEVVPEEDLTELIQTYILDNYIGQDNIAYVIQDLETNEIYAYNEDLDYVIASVYKLPLAMVYYDLINEGSVSLSDQYLYTSDYSEAGGVIYNSVAYDTYLTVEYLLETLILYSDNSAGHILYWHLGGWLSYKEAIMKYSDMEYDETFTTSYDNYQTATYLNDVLVYLYEHSDEYEILIEDMRSALPYDYLNYTVETNAIQKYGWYNEAMNAIGIVEANHDYAITILTTLGDDNGEYHIGNINEICYEYFNSYE